MFHNFRNDRNRKIVFCMLVVSLMGSCTHAVHQYHVSDFQPTRAIAKDISARSEQQVVLGFTTQSDYVDRAYRQLQKSCRKGRITGIHTRYSTSHSFMSWTNKIVMHANCYK